jgi:hypothetical protein
VVTARFEKSCRLFKHSLLRVVRVEATICAASEPVGREGLTEAAIEAMSLAVLERGWTDNLYLSTGGGWSPATDAAIRALAGRDDVLLVAATDNNAQGERYADRLESAALEIGCAFARLRPRAVDWNVELKAKAEGQGVMG